MTAPGSGDPAPQADTPPGGAAAQAAGLHHQVLAALDLAAAVAVDAGGVASSGQWHPGELLAGRGLVDAAGHLVFADQGDPAQIEHAGLWCPARVLSALACLRDTVERHDPQNQGEHGVGCGWCDIAGFPCVDYRAAARMIPTLPRKVADELARH